MLRRIVLATSLLLMFALPVFAQDVSVVGTVMDESKAVLPGAVVTATEVSSGRTYDAVTNERGDYRLLGLGPGRYEIKAELSGFATIVLSNLEFLVGQNATVPITLKVASLEESVTVTSTSPLVDLRSAQIAGNVDPRQMESIPIAGRDWLSLSANVAGLLATNQFGKFNLNLDGQRITQETSVTSFGQPGISRDAIAEYQVITSPYDVSNGNSVGLEVQAISKSGSNFFDGSFYGYFRHDKLNTANPFTGVVLPFQQQQVGGTFGGPIVQSQTHFFGSYERERNPNTVNVIPTALAPQRITAETADDKFNYLGRIDHQFSNRDHFVVRGNYSNRLIPNDGVTSHPSRSAKKDTTSYSIQANWTHAATNGVLQEVKVGYFRYYWTWGPADGLILTPEYQFPGLTLGLNWNYPEFIRQARLPLSYALTQHRGDHDIKIGGEWNIGLDDGDWPARQRGQYFFSVLPADAGARFPLDRDASAWNFTGLDSTVTRFDRTYSSDWKYNVPRKMYAGWVSDTWRVSDQLTLNLGLRYDLAWGEFAPPNVNETELIIDNGKFTENVGYRTNIRDKNNFGPRVGFVWNVGSSNDLSIRGGTGLFYSGVGANPAFDMQLWNGQRVIFNSYVNDGRSGFLADPARGVSDADILSGRAPKSPQAISVIDPAIQTPKSWQASLGFQKQLGPVTGIEANVVYLQGYHQESVRDPNVFYDPTIGWPRNPVRFGRPARDFGPIRLIGTDGRSETLTLPVTFTRRYSKNFQLNVIYTLVMFNRNAGVGGSGYGNDQINPFDINYNWGDAGSDRHSARAYGVWNLPLGMNLSGVWRYSSGDYSTYSSGLDPLAGYGRNRLRADLSWIPRSTFKNESEHSADIRFAKNFSLRSGVRLEAIAEAFNVYVDTRKSYDLRENSRTFLQVSNISGIRSGQLAFRLTF